MEFGNSRQGGDGVASRRNLVRERRLASRKNQVRAQAAHFGARDPLVLDDMYRAPVSFYDSSPGGDIGLIDLETLAVERLRLLRLVEKYASLSSDKFSKEWADKLEAEITNTSELEQYSSKGLRFNKMANEQQQVRALLNRERDHFSHFILRLAYCKTEDTRRWFIAQECDLFRCRYSKMSEDEIASFIEANSLDFIGVSQEEIEELGDKLSFGFFQPGKTPQPKNFYKVPFTEVLDLVRGRKVYIKNGMCYVPDTEMISLISWIFKSHLSQALLHTLKLMPNTQEDARLCFLGDLDRRYTGADYSAKEGEAAVTPEMVRPLSEKSFPLCMQAMQHTVSTTHHLKYKARLQYGLFLKGIGLSLDDAIRFFRGEFTQAHVDADKFDKEYTYGIRYNYGKEGKKVNWAPWNCMRIIMENVGPGEGHGCPYRHHDTDTLRSMLVRSGVEGDKLTEILQTVKEGHFQKACSMQFQARHIGQEISTGMVNHPNQYYYESIHGGAPSNQTKLKVKTERVLQYSSGDVASQES